MRLLRSHSRTGSGGIRPGRYDRRPHERTPLGRVFLGAVVAAFAAALLAPVGPTAAPSGALARSFPGGAYFVLVCGFSHRNNDDPVVFPGQPGRSHNHTYIGNRTVDAASTPASLRGGPTTCETDDDASTYWVPSLVVGRKVVTPLVGVVYYVKRTAAEVAPFPADLKMVAGNPSARRAQPLAIASWGCGSIGGTKRQATVPVCADDELLELRVEFPNCWNGRETDSPNHRRHMAYSTGRSCPKSHPVEVPTISLILLYDPVPRGAQVSSGKFALHADFMNGWDQAALARLVAGLNY